MAVTTRWLRAALVSAALALSPGCSGEQLTEIVLVVDTDASIPAQLDRIQIVVHAPGGAESLNSERPVGTPAALPLTLGLVHGGGPLGPLSVDVVGRGAAGTPMIETRRETWFVRGESRMLYVWLSESCAGVTCSDTRDTCIDGGCASASVPPELLPPWTGVPQGRDGGVMAGDGSVTCGDPPCVRANATVTCDTGACAIKSCNAGWGSCDGIDSNGCEAPLQWAGPYPSPPVCLSSTWNCIQGCDATADPDCADTCLAEDPNPECIVCLTQTLAWCARQNGCLAEIEGLQCCLADHCDSFTPDQECGMAYCAAEGALSVTCTEGLGTTCAADVLACFGAPDA